MSREIPIHASVSDLFFAHVGKGKAIEVADLARLTGVEPARVYDYLHGTHLNAAVALVQLCRQSPEAFAALKSLVAKGAQQGCELLVNREIAAAGLAFADAISDGKVDHRERITLRNVARRLKVRLGFYDAHHAQRPIAQAAAE